MLGIRRYKGASIDLWQGDQTLFACDVAVVLDPKKDVGAIESLRPGGAAGLCLSLGSGGGFGEADLSRAYADCFNLAEQEAARHIVFPELVPMGIADGSEFGLRTVKQILEQSALEHVSRITFVLADLGTYDRYQSALFVTFPEDDECLS